MGEQTNVQLDKNLVESAARLSESIVHALVQDVQLQQHDAATAADVDKTTTTAVGNKTTTATTTRNGAQHSPIAFLLEELRSVELPEGLSAPRSFPARDMLEEFRQHTPDELASYQDDVRRAVNRGDLSTLQSICREQGRCLETANPFGESLLHGACRLGSVPIAKFLITEAHCSVMVCDQQGMTPLHMACRTPKPNFELVDLLVSSDSDLLFVADQRGYTPMDCTPRGTWGDWIVYLQKRIEKYGLLSLKPNRPMFYSATRRRPSMAQNNSSLATSDEAAGKPLVPPEPQKVALQPSSQIPGGPAAYKNPFLDDINKLLLAYDAQTSRKERRAASRKKNSKAVATRRNSNGSSASTATSSNKMGVGELDETNHSQNQPATAAVPYHRRKSGSQVAPQYNHHSGPGESGASGYDTYSDSQPSMEDESYPPRANRLKEELSEIILSKLNNSIVDGAEYDEEARAEAIKLLDGLSAIEPQRLLQTLRLKRSMEFEIHHMERVESQFEETKAKFEMVERQFLLELNRLAHAESGVKQAMAMEMVSRSTHRHASLEVDLAKASYTDARQSIVELEAEYYRMRDELESLGRSIESQQQRIESQLQRQQNIA